MPRNSGHALFRRSVAHPHPATEQANAMRAFKEAGGHCDKPGPPNSKKYGPNVPGRTACDLPKGHQGTHHYR